MEIRPFTRAEAEGAAAWEYTGELAIYNGDPSDIDIFMTIDRDGLGYYVMADDGDEMIGFCCYGVDATVPGQGPPPAGTVDIGISVMPERLGEGLGSKALPAVLEFARLRLGAIAYRAAIATFNQRSLRLFEKTGFTRVRMIPGSRGITFVEVVRGPE